MNTISRSDNSKVLDLIIKEAIEFGSKEQLNAYMKKHPRANPKNHKVLEKKPQKANPKKHKVIERNTESQKNIDNKKQEITQSNEINDIIQKEKPQLKNKFYSYLSKKSDEFANNFKKGSEFFRKHILDERFDMYNKPVYHQDKAALLGAVTVGVGAIAQVLSHSIPGVDHHLFTLPILGLLTTGISGSMVASSRLDKAFDGASALSKKLSDWAHKKSASIKTSSEMPDDLKNELFEYLTTITPERVEISKKYTENGKLNLQKFLDDLRVEKF